MSDLIFTAILSVSFAVYAGYQFYLWAQYRGIEAISTFLSGTVSIVAAVAIWRLM